MLRPLRPPRPLQPKACLLPSCLSSTGSIHPHQSRLRPRPRLRPRLRGTISPDGINLPQVNQAPSHSILDLICRVLCRLIHTSQLGIIQFRIMVRIRFGISTSRLLPSRLATRTRRQFRLLHSIGRISNGTGTTGQLIQARILDIPHRHLKCHPWARLPVLSTWMGRCRTSPRLSIPLPPCQHPSYLRIV